MAVRGLHEETYSVALRKNAGTVGSRAVTMNSVSAPAVYSIDTRTAGRAGRAVDTINRAGSQNAGVLRAVSENAVRAGTRAVHAVTAIADAVHAVAAHRFSENTAIESAAGR